MPLPIYPIFSVVYFVYLLMSEIDNRSLRLAYVVPKINATIVEQALIFNNVKPVVSLIGSLSLMHLSFLFSISFLIVHY